MTINCPLWLGMVDQTNWARALAVWMAVVEERKGRCWMPGLEPSFWGSRNHIFRTVIWWDLWFCELSLTKVGSLGWSMISWKSNWKVLIIWRTENTVMPSEHKDVNKGDIVEAKWTVWQSIWWNSKEERKVCGRNICSDYSDSINFKI